MEGLEISVLNKSDAFDPFFKARLDPEFFQYKYVSKYDLILSKKYKILADLAFVTDGEHGNAKTLPEGYSKYYGARNVLNGILNDNGVEFITKEHHNKLRKTELKPRDLLISCVGANIGYAAIVPDDVGIGNIVRNVALIRSKSDILNEYLLAYFLSKYGKNLFIRMNTGNAQPLVSLDYINTIPVFIPSNDFQIQIQSLIKRSLLSNNSSKEKYHRAEILLSQVFDLKNFQSSNQPVNIKIFSKSFGISGRLDAEYYQLKYEDYIYLINSYSGGHQSFTKACNLRDKNFNPEDKTEYKYVELSNIGKSGEIVDCTFEMGEELPTRARRKIKTNDVIISSIEGSLDSCALVTPEYDNALCSTGFYVINSPNINPETLLVLFKSEPIQNLLKKGCSGTILTAINKSELQKIPIPLIDKVTQEKIKNKVNESFELRNQSNHLLQVAKRAVEIAIEQDEKSALEFIKSEIGNNFENVI